jgi:uncharacterized protein YkwD
MLRALLPAAIAGVCALAVPAGAEPARGALADRLLSAHNSARDDARQPRLAWSDELAQEAGEWAERLARDGDLRHSPQDSRSDTGENLWMGSSGFYAPEAMIGAFIGEKGDFRPGIFPDVSATGSWEDVGHYTQIIWPQTRKVGCALAQGRRMDILVCRYWPAGNWMGRRVG